jgi:AraC-like DNA-binding protein
LSYRELAPDARLQGYVACYWVREVTAAIDASQVVLPDGCIDFLFEASTGKLEVIGTMTRAIRVEGRGPERFVGVRFKPGGAVPFLRDRADLVTDRSEELREAELVEQLGGRSIEDQVQLLEAFLLARLPQAKPVDRRIAFAAARLVEYPAQRVEVLARDLALSRQFLRRLFLEHTGVTPKVFARIARMRRALELIETEPLAEAALEAGYADQAHLTKELKDLVGMTPSEWKQR